MIAGVASRRRTARGLTYVELSMVVAIMGVLALSALPTARTVKQRAQERELRRALQDIRSAIDSFRKDWEQGSIEPESKDGWPESLEELTEEFDFKPPPGSPEETLGPTTKTYLTRIPRDPFNVDPSVPEGGEPPEWDVNGWRARSYDDEPDSSSWGGEGVYDVYSSSTRKALDGTLYETW